MPRLYVSPSELTTHQLGIVLAQQFSQMQASGIGSIDQALARASQRVDSYAKKRIQSPGATTLTQTAGAGTSLLTVASTLTFDDKADLAAIVGTGGGQEILPILPGGVVVTSWSPPYPGTIQLALPLQNTHNSGESLQGCFQETIVARSSSSADRYTENLLSQQAQIAAAHAPPIAQGGSNLTRKVFTKQYPIQQIFKAEHAFPFTSTYFLLDVSSLIIEAMSGFYKFQLGTVVLPHGFVRTTYQAGYQAIPDDIKYATMCYLADEMQAFGNPYGVESQTQGKRSTRWAAESIWVKRACMAIEEGNYKRHT